MLGHLTQNFALLIIEENMGRYMNNQMTVYFKQADRSICDLIGNDEGFMWNELDMDEIAELSIEQIEEDYENYCCGKLVLNESNYES